jgi:Glycosyl hydrolase family 79, N-terminal domain.
MPFPRALTYIALRNRARRLLGLRTKTNIKDLAIRCSTDQLVNQTAPEYLSFSIDISVVVGGFWWEGSKGVRRGLGTLRVPALDLSKQRLDILTQALAPAYLRVGGSEADKIHYFHNPEGEPDALVLSRDMWNNLHKFIQRNHLKFYFTVKYGLFNRRQHGDWQGTEIQSLLQYSKDHNYTINICELGNELNAYWAFHGLKSQPSAVKLAHDYSTFTQLLRHYYPSIKIAGPGSAFWPKLGETVRPVSNLSEKFLQTSQSQLDIVDWHYYPFQSTRTPLRTRTATLKKFLSPSSFEDFAHFSDRLKHWRDLYQPNAELWTGETGSAQCGGEPRLSDRFTSSFWWADQLGRGASIGQKVMIRQSLIGGDYGMIDRLTLKPRPDYWVSWFWKQLMGTAVYRAESSSRRIRAYLHRHPDGERYTLLMINLTDQKQSPDISGLGGLQQQYVITAKKLTSRKLHVNGIRPKIKHLENNAENKLLPFAMRQLSRDLQPFSISFWIYSRSAKN